MTRPVTRRDFLRISAAGAAAAAAPALLPPLASPAAAAHQPYPGAGSTAPVRPFPLPAVRLGAGLFRDKQARMLHFARQYDERRFLVLFNDNAGRTNPSGLAPPGGWEDGGLLSGHWAGHFLTLLAQSYAATGEAVFRTKLDWMVAELATCQAAITARMGGGGGEGWVPTHPGYLGAIPEDAVLRAGPPRFAVYGGNPQTNTWAPWYTQHKIMRGLLDAYHLTDNPQAREVVVAMAEWAYLALTLGDVNHPDYAGPITRDDLNYMWDTYIAGEFGGANEVLAEIYALTGDARHLQTAKRFDNRESLFDACVDGRDILVTTDATRPGRRRPNVLHANTHVPQFTGYVRVFEQTGEADYHLAAKNFFDMVVPHRMFSHGGIGSQFLPLPPVAAGNNNSELFQPRGDISRNLLGGQYATGGQTVTITGTGAETCTTYNLLKLARNLFFHDPDPAYLDYYERGLVNHILGSRQDGDSATSPQVTYFLPPFSGASRSYGNTGTCCGGTGMENHTKYQEAIYFRSADGATLWVNLYLASSLTWDEAGFTIVQETDYPRQQGSRLTVQGSGPLEIRLRVPGWAEAGFTVAVNGAAQDLDATPGSYLALRRTWSSGDTIEVSVPFRLRVERALDDPAVQSLFYGPVLLAVLGAPLGDPPDRRFLEFSWYGQLKRDGDLGRAVSPAGAVNHFTSQGRTLRPLYVGDGQALHLYFRRAEPEVRFGSVSAGVPNDGRPDGEGLTFLDRVWEAAPFATHGLFMQQVGEIAAEWVQAGRYTTGQRQAILTAAVQAEQELAP